MEMVVILTVVVFLVTFCLMWKEKDSQTNKKRKKKVSV